MQYFNLSYSYTLDHRDSKAYPLRGYQAVFVTNKLGLGILADEKLDVMYVEASFKKYWGPAKKEGRCYFVTGVKGKWSSLGYQPYYVQRGLGYGDYVRGYEYYVIDGQRYGMAKMEFRYELVKPRIQKVNALGFEKFNTFHYAFYLSGFSDFGYAHNRYTASNQKNPLENKFLMGNGIGLDFVSYYDVVLRLEYSINRLQEHGFFVHFTSPI